MFFDFIGGTFSKTSYSYNNVFQDFQPFFPFQTLIRHLKQFLLAIAANKEFLENCLIHKGVGQKVMLVEKALAKLMAWFQILSSPNVYNIFFSFQNIGMGRVINQIMNLKSDSAIDYIHIMLLIQGKYKDITFSKCSQWDMRVE